MDNLQEEMINSKSSTCKGEELQKFRLHLVNLAYLNLEKPSIGCVNSMV